MKGKNENINAPINEKLVWDFLQEIKDPEIPALSIIDLGIVREIKFQNNPLGDGGIEVVITPTYIGCPAMDMIAATIKIQLATLGFKKIKISQVLAPAWTTDWMSEEGKRKLKEYGIAPPNPKQQVCDPKLFAAAEAVQCPHCDSYHTHRISEFGSTPCKALYQCDDCKEPFDYFKCH